MEQRLIELEEAMDSLLQHPEWQDAQLERLERRVLQLEPAVRVLRRQLADVVRRMDDKVADENLLDEPVAKEPSTPSFRN
jgi:hypothetical protein